MQARTGPRAGQTEELATSIDTALPVPYSRPLDVNRWSDYPELSNCLDQLVAEIEGNEARQRSRTGNAARKFREAIRCIVLDLYVSSRLTPDCEIGVSLGKGAFTTGSRYGALFLTYDTFRPAFGGLEALGYLQIVRNAFHDPVTGIGRTTRICATDKLVRLLTDSGQLTASKVGFRHGVDSAEVIVLRDSDKRDIEYDDTPEIQAMRADLQRINSRLSKSWTDLYLSDEDLAALNVRMQSDHAAKRREAPFVDFNAKRLRRIFNNSEWSQGGRFYGGWWQSVPRDYRPFITIDGKHTVEVDYSGLHPAMMYAQAGSPLEGDPYDIGISSVPREIVKRTFNKMINASGRMRPTEGFDATVHGVSWTELMAVIRARHEPIAAYFNTEHGLRLQNVDAEIANRVMLRFLVMGYVCLPVHDSFIVHHALRDELAAIMADEFHSTVGRSIASKVKPEYLASYKPKHPRTIPAELVISELLGNKGEHAGYHAREIEWLGTR